MRARVVYFEGCPNAEPAERLVRNVAADVGVEIEVARVEVFTPEDTVRERMLGSPTIQIDGVDVEPAARDRRDYAMSCRVYAGGEGLPPRAMVRAAITGEAYQTSDGACGCSSKGCCS